ncbi:acyltransferase domain-containing protein [Streptomyces sp. WAC05292]|jgi:acyl transferase domain-containing protein|uniref:acyltransferase domain-containing protein n=1 Tax=Streptomyces sp. WAC05292 TaxID=2487418 RepID=UPI000264454F|nr:acyltransferase domain-containing protein [Streptomyces sp. WAC05292]AFK80338.1 putative acyltransferase [Streptomyces sp. WAC05292]RSS97608.1 acyltransferase domain-containing protein [Streptomyces sp. WAC05292]
MSPRLFAVAADTEELLRDLLGAHLDRIRAGRALPPLARYCHEAAAGTTGVHRLAFAVDSYDELRTQLEAACAGEVGRIPADVTARRPKLVFVFAGQGAQWYGMGRELLAREPVFREALLRCDRLVGEFAGFSAVEQLRLPTGKARLDELDVLQPTMVSLQIALTALWRSWGVTPDAVVGHSMGEIAAAHTAGGLTLRDALKVACRRSALLRRISGKGALATTELSPAEAQAVAEASGGGISVAGENSPRSTVLAGDSDSLAALVGELEAKDVYCRVIKGTVASHSHYVEELREDLHEALRTVAPAPTRLPMYSTVTAEPVPDAGLGAAYWMRNLREPVRFAAAVEHLSAAGHEVFLEVSAHPVLLSPMRQTLEDGERQGWLLPSGRRRAEVRSMLTSLGTLYACGREPDWAALSREERADALTPYQAAVLEAARRPRPVPVAAGRAVSA